MVKVGLSLIEILVVIAILALLASLTMVAASALGMGSKRAKTDGILAAALSAIEHCKAETGGLPEPAEHPVARSAATRRPFVRASDGSAVAGSGEALVGVALTQVPAAARNRVLLPDDLCADADQPMYFGWPRGRCTVLYVPQAAVTRMRRLPPNQLASANPDTSGTLVIAAGTASAQPGHLDRVLARGGLDGEIRGLGGLAPLPATWVQPLLGGSLVSNVAAGGSGTPHWEPGRVADGPHPTVGGAKNWKPYRLPSVTLVDGWGREIVYWLGESNQVTVGSAGLDGAFAVDPGSNRLLDTSDARGPIHASDEDGKRDNRYAGMRP